MRGSQKMKITTDMIAGIIPAHAGLTDIDIMNVIGQRDHPRACGAHINYGRSKDVPLGSSPRMRGSRALDRIPTYGHRIIPAHAGLTIPVL